MKLANAKIEEMAQSGRYMTVRDLIEALRECDLDALVVFSTTYGDYHDTMQALPVETVDELDDGGEVLIETAYSRSGVGIAHAFESGEFDEDDTDELPHPECGVVVLR